MASTLWVHWGILGHCKHIQKILNFCHILRMYLPCVFNFPSSVHCKDVASTFWMNQSGKCWSNWVSTLQMDSECPNLVCDGHMTWYIARNIQNKPLKHILMAFCWNVQNILVDFWFGTLWSHDLVHFEHIWHYPKPGHCCHICLVHLKYSRHMLVWYGVSSSSQN